MAASQSDGVPPVVVGVDDTAAGDAALAYAAHAATVLRAPLVLVHGCDSPHSGADTMLEASAEPELVAKQTLAIAVERAQDLLAGQAQVEARVRPGPLTRCLTEASMGASLLVVGRHQPVALGTVVNRSVPARLAADAHCPVVVVPAGWGPSSGSEPVTVGVDVPALSHTALEAGFRMAAAEHRPLRVLHLWRPTRLAERVTLSHIAGQEWLPPTEKERRRQLEVAIARAAGPFPDVSVSLDLEPALASQALEAASRSSALVVLGRHNHMLGGWPTLGSVAGYVLRKAHCPVVVVPPPRRVPRELAGVAHEGSTLVPASSN